MARVRLITKAQRALFEAATGVEWPKALSYSAARDLAVAFWLARREPRYRPCWRHLVRAYGGPKRLPPDDEIRWDVAARRRDAAEENELGLDASPQLSELVRRALCEYAALYTAGAGKED